MRSRAPLSVALSLGVLLSAAATGRAAQANPGMFRQSYELESRGDINGALSVMDKVPAGSDIAYVVALRRGWLLYLAGRYADAVVAYDRAVTLEPQAAEPRLGVMLPLMALRRWKEAERHGTEVLGRTPGDFTARSRLAFIHYNLGRYAEAEASYRKALAAFPSNVEMRAGLGWSLLKQGRPKDARVEFERALAIAPDLTSAKEGITALAPAGQP